MSRALAISMIVAIVTGAATVRLLGEPAGEHDARQAADRSGKHIVVPADQLEWKDGPEALPTGAQMVVLEGNPASEGMFTMRIRVPANYRIPPHTHPKLERVTVLRGTFKLGMGRAFDEQNLQELKEGSFATMPAGMEHFAMSGDEQTIVQLTAMGPWEIHYINPDDDPRKR